jgi:quinoprotein glucose dehydrogenase
MRAVQTILLAGAATLLIATGNATPITCQVNGRQYVVLYATGGRKRGDPSGGVYVAFSLRKE